MASARPTLCSRSTRCTASLGDAALGFACNIGLLSVAAVGLPVPSGPQVADRQPAGCPSADPMPPLSVPCLVRSKAQTMPRHHRIGAFGSPWIPKVCVRLALAPVKKARHGILQELVLRLPSLRAIYINGQRISSSPQERNRFAACVRLDWLGVYVCTVCTAAWGVRACERARLRVYLWVRARVLACGVASCSAQEAPWSHSIARY